MASIPRKSERDIDLLLAEELSVSPAFAEWFVSQTKFAGAAYRIIEVRVSPSDASGETDLEARFIDGPGNAFALLIEDKVGARFQDGQLERYHQRAKTAMEQGLYSNYEVVLCSPLAYFNDQPKAKEFPCFVSYEDIADQLVASIGVGTSSEDARKRYRADFLRTAATKAINKWVGVYDDATDSFWSAAYSIATREFPILEMKEPHYTKGTTWITLRPSCLPTQPKRVYVELKGKRGYADLTFASTIALEFQNRIQEHLGNLTVHRTGRAAVIRRTFDPFAIADGLDTGPAKVRGAFAAAEELVLFYKKNRLLLDLAAAKSSMPNI